MQAHPPHPFLCTWTAATTADPLQQLLQGRMPQQARQQTAQASKAAAARRQVSSGGGEGGGRRPAGGRATRGSTFTAAHKQKRFECLPVANEVHARGQRRANKALQTRRDRKSCKTSTHNVKSSKVIGQARAGECEGWAGVGEVIRTAPARQMLKKSVSKLARRADRDRLLDRASQQRSAGSALPPSPPMLHLQLRLRWTRRSPT